MLERVVIMKMLNGDDIICTAQAGKENIQVNVPCVIVPSDSQPGNFMFVPWMYTVEAMGEDEWVNVNPLSVITMTTPFKDMQDAYETYKNNIFSKIIKPNAEETKLILQN